MAIFRDEPVFRSGEAARRRERLAQNPFISMRNTGPRFSRAVSLRRSASWARAVAALPPPSRAARPLASERVARTSGTPLPFRLDHVSLHATPAYIPGSRQPPNVCRINAGAHLGAWIAGGLPAARSFDPAVVGNAGRNRARPGLYNVDVSRCDHHVRRRDPLPLPPNRSRLNHPHFGLPVRRFELGHFGRNSHPGRRDCFVCVKVLLVPATTAVSKTTGTGVLAYEKHSSPFSRAPAV